MDLEKTPVQEELFRILGRLSRALLQGDKEAYMREVVLALGFFRYVFEFHLEELNRFFEFIEPILDELREGMKRRGAAPSA